jgi:hypothetical protein
MKGDVDAVARFRDKRTRTAAAGTAGSQPVAWTFRLLCLLPLAWAGQFAAFVVRARVALGRWPYAYHPDPKELGFGLHDAAVLWGMQLLFAAPFGLLALLLAARKRPDLLPRRPLLWLAWYAASFAALLVVARFDPGGFLNWYAD